MINEPSRGPTAGGRLRDTQGRARERTPCGDRARAGMARDPTSAGPGLPAGPELRTAAGARFSARGFGGSPALA